MYYKNYGHYRDAREMDAALSDDRRATTWTECRRCEQACPSRLVIVEKLKEAYGRLA